MPFELTEEQGAIQETAGSLKDFSVEGYLRDPRVHPILGGRHEITRVVARALHRI